MAELQRTTLNRTWLIKFGLFALVCFGLGSWFLYDAMVIYPDRGRADAEFQLKEYLTRVQERGEVASDLRIAEPVARLAELQGKKDELQKASSDAAGLSMTNSEQAARLRPLLPKLAEKEELDWLESLKTVGDLKPEKTTVSDWRGTLQKLKDKWSATDAPKPLASYDIPLQWALFVVCYAVLAWLVWLIFRSMTTSYTWDPQSKTLTLPGGQKVTPANFTDLDKRGWDRFYATLLTTDGPPHKLDLLRFTPLEEWVLELERIKFPDRAAEAKKPEEPAPVTPPAE